MKLESVLELKSSLVGQLAQTLTTAPKEVAAYGMAARNVKRVDKIQRSVALGVHPAEHGDFKLAVRIQRRGLEDGTQVELIRQAAKGEVEVRYIGRVTKLDKTFFRARHRPVLIGTSVGHFAITCGTVGGFVKLKKDGSVRLLSNNHVLADENRARLGDAVIQPGAYDSGSRARDKIGRLVKFVRLTSPRSNKVDCALAALDSDIKYEASKLTGIDGLKGTFKGPLAGGEHVEKLGRTTGHTKGRITAFDLDNVVVGYDTGNFAFDNQIEIEGLGSGPFCQGGDSGSMIFTSADHLAVALLFAGSDQGGTNGKGLTFANPLATVLTQLRAELLI